MIDRAHMDETARVFAAMLRQASEEETEPMREQVQFYLHLFERLHDEMAAWNADLRAAIARELAEPYAPA
jgi:hypothetical protein